MVSGMFGIWVWCVVMMLVVCLGFGFGVKDGVWVWCVEMMLDFMCSGDVKGVLVVGYCVFLCWWWYGVGVGCCGCLLGVGL